MGDTPLSHQHELYNPQSPFHSHSTQGCITYRARRCARCRTYATSSQFLRKASSWRCTRYQAKRVSSVDTKQSTSERTQQAHRSSTLSSSWSLLVMPRTTISISDTTRTTLTEEGIGNTHHGGLIDYGRCK